MTPRSLSIAAGLCLVAAFVLAQASSLDLTLGAGGLEIRTQHAGALSLPLPSLRLTDKDYAGEQPAVSVRSATTAVGSYPSGAKVTLNVSVADQLVRYSFESVPDTAQAFVFQLPISIDFRNGGRFSFDGGNMQRFPQERGEQLIAHGRAVSFTLYGPSGAGLRITAPAGYQQVQDNRVFGRSHFLYLYHFALQPAHGTRSVTFRFETLQTTAFSPVPSESGATYLVDRYGQSASKDYPGKVKLDEELKADVARQESRLRPLDGPPLDAYGGLLGSSGRFDLKKTGYFQLGKAGVRWVLVTPQGNAFFQLGVCGISMTDDYTLVSGRETSYAWIPPKEGPFASAWRPQSPGVVSFYIANWIKKFNRPFDLEEWTGQVVRRARSWGFNSGGAFSTYTATMRRAHFPFVAMLPSGKEYGAKMLPRDAGHADLLDPFASGSEAALDRAFAIKVAPQASDPLLIGYFQGNEQRLELLPKLLPAYRASEVAAKGKLVEVLQAKYREIGKFNAAWSPVKPFASFDDLKEEPLVVQTTAGMADMRAFHRLFLDALYAMTTRVFRRYDRNHLLIGSRFTPAAARNKDCVEVASRYLDVISINYYTYRLDRGFLEQVQKWSGGKPILLSEWYYGSNEHGLRAGFDVKNEKERAKAYRHYVEHAAATPFIVGSQWFIFNDQSITGRFFQGFHGEGNNTGLVSVTDRPYEALVEATRTTGARIYDVMLGNVAPYVFEDARFSEQPTK